MSEANSLRAHWANALVFHIGEEGSRALPDAKDFPSTFQDDHSAIDNSQRADSLGHVLALAKLRAARQQKGRGFFEATFIHVAQEDVRQRMPGAYASVVADSIVSYLGRVAYIAVVAPERLLALLAHLDDLDNDRLHGLAMDAVEGRPVCPWVFDAVEGFPSPWGVL